MTDTQASTQPVSDDQIRQTCLAVLEHMGYVADDPKWVAQLVNNVLRYLQRKPVKDTFSGETWRYDWRDSLRIEIICETIAQQFIDVVNHGRLMDLQIRAMIVSQHHAHQASAAT